MNPTTDEENLVRWLDGEMDAAEQARYEARLEADPVLKAEAMEMKALTQTVRTHLPQPGDIPHADFFNSQIQREILVLKATETKQAAESPSILSWLRMPWLLAGAAAIAAILSVTKVATEVHSTEVVNVYTPNPAVTVAASSVQGATVLLLEGLPEIPANLPVVGFKVHRTETAPAMAMTTLFGESGEVLLVMAQK